MSVYKRISYKKFNHGLFQVDDNTHKNIVLKYGKNDDYYESIYNYKEKHYLKFINGLKECCNFLKLEYSDNPIDQIKIHREILFKLKSLKERGNDEYLKYKALISLSGIQDVTTNKLVFDFDCQKDITQAQKETAELIDRLEKSYGVNEENIKIYFSGSKGFHIELPINQDISRYQFEQIVFNMTKDLVTFDPSVRDEQRLLRLPLTRHPSTKLYKIPITKEELISSVEYIKDIAKTLDDSYELQSTFNAVEPIDIDVPENITPKEHIEVDINEISKEFDIKNRPLFLTPEKYALQEGFFGPKERNDALHILASTYHASNFDKDTCKAMLSVVIQKQASRNNMEPYDINQLDREILDHVYSPTFRGGQYSRKTSPLLQSVAERLNIPENPNEEQIQYLTSENLITEWIDYAKNFKSNRVLTGLKSLDDKLDLLTGRPTGIVAGPGAGKTSFILQLLEHNSIKGENSLFFSLDMGKPDIASRCLLRYTDFNYREAMQIVENGEINKKLEYGIEQYKENFKNVAFDFVRGPTVEDLEKRLIQYQNDLGVKFKMVVVDYLEKLVSPYGSDAMASVNYIIPRLTNIAVNNNILMVILLQPNKMAGDTWDELSSANSIKGSKITEQDLRFVGGLWRPGSRVKHIQEGWDRWINFSVLKDNNGQKFTETLNFNPINGKIWDMTEDDKKKYKEFERICKQDEEDEEYESYRERLSKVKGKRNGGL